MMNQAYKEQLLTRYENGDESVFEEAVELFEKGLKEDPNNLTNLHYYGRLFELKGRRYIEKAAQIYERGVEQSLNELDKTPIHMQKCHGQLIGARKALGQIEKSVDVYKEMISQNPNIQSLYIHLTHSYLAAHQIEEAQLTIEAGYKLFAKSSLMSYWRAEVCAAADQVEEAIKYFEESLVYDEDLIDSHFSLAFLFERINKIACAIQKWEKIIEWLKIKGYNTAEDLAYPTQQLERLQADMSC